MKIIQIIPAFVLAGAETMCENLIYGLQEKGVDVIAVSLFNKHTAITDRLEQKGVRIVYLDKKLGFDFSIFGKLRRLFRQEKPDAIHTHLYATKYAVPAAILAGVKSRVHTVHNVAEKENKRLGRILNKCFFKINHVVPIALSGKIQESIIKEYKIKKENIPVVFNGIDLTKCKTKTDYSLKEKFSVLHIGRFVEQKNHAGLIEAFSIFHQKYPDSVLQLIGDGEKKSEIEELVKQKNLISCVEFLGPQSNVYGFLNKADVFVLPSLYEGNPMTLIEAMGTGLPIVATSVGGVPDMLKNEETALLCNVDAIEIANALEKLYENMTLRKNLGKAAQLRAEEFSLNKMTEGYIQAYNSSRLE